MPSDESGENATSSTTGMAATNNTGDVDDGGGDVREVAKGIREFSVPSAQHCCEPITTL